MSDILLAIYTLASHLLFTDADISLALPIDIFTNHGAGYV